MDQHLTSKTLKDLSQSSKSVTELIKFLTPDELAELNYLTQTDPVWKPLPRQRKAYESKADILFYGGAAGGGKTDLLVGIAMYEHTRSIIFRREYRRLLGIIDRSRSLYSQYGSYNSNTMAWQFKDSDKKIEFGACQLESDKENYQGRDHDFVGFDEITQFTATQFKFLINWCRSAKPGQRARIICAGNPPLSAEGEWVIDFWAPWLNENHPDYPAEPGELKWYIVDKEGKDVEVDSDKPVIIDGEMIIPKSRTFIPAFVDDNPYLITSGYKATLQALPPEHRAKLLHGQFSKATADHEFQVIPSAWIIAAQDRWEQFRKERGPMTHVGVDVARGGADRTVISPRYGVFSDNQIVIPGKETPDPGPIVQIAKSFRIYEPVFYVDVIGVGAAVYDALKRESIAVYGVQSSEASRATDRYKQLKFVNKRAELWWHLRDLLDPDNKEQIALPPDAELRRELCTPHWEETVRGIKIESKEDIKKRTKKSIDKADSMVYSYASVAVQYAQYVECNFMRR